MQIALLDLAQRQLIPMDSGVGRHDRKTDVIDTSALTIALESADQPEVRAMLAASDAYMEGLYPPESNHLLGIGSLLTSNVRFLVARQDGVAVGCGAVLLGADRCGEIKRMWVAPKGRGRGTGRQLLKALEAIARQEGMRALRLETGIAQPEALGLYRRAGFNEIPAFGSYKPDPASLFMEKRLV